MKLYVRLEAPCEWVRVSGLKVEAFGEVPSLADCPLSDEDDLIGVVPGQWVTAHRVALPARTRKQFQTAVPYALEEAVAEDVDDLHFVSHQWKAGEPTTVFVVAQEKMLEWQQAATQAKLPLDRMVPDYTVLPFHEAAESTLALSSSQAEGETLALARHQNGMGASLDASFIEVWLQDIPLPETIAVTDRDWAEQLIKDFPERDFKYWDAGKRLAHWLEYPQTDTIDIMGEQYRPAVRSMDWRRFTMPLTVAACAIFVLLAFNVYRYFALHAEIDQVLEQQAGVLQNSFPEISEVPEGTARALMERALQNSAGKPMEHNATSMLAAAASVLRGQNVTLTEAIFRDGRLTISCALNDLSQVDRITQGLSAQRGLRAELDSSATENGRLIASYILQAG